MKKFILLIVLVLPSYIISESLSLPIANTIIIDFPSNLKIEKKLDFISSYNDDFLYQQVYLCQYDDHTFLLYVYCKAKEDVGEEIVARKYNVPIRRVPPRFGSDQLVERILQENSTFELDKNHAELRYIFRNGDDYGKNDLAAFYIKLNQHALFSELLIQINNIWIDQEDPIIPKLNTDYIITEILLGNKNASIYGILRKSMEGIRFILN